MEAVPAAMLMNLGIMLTTIPMTAWFYYEIPVFSMIINLLIIPFMGLLLGLGFSGSLIGSFFFPAGYEILQPCGPILSFYEKVATVSASLPWSTWTVGRPKLAGIVIYYVILAAALWAGRRISEEIENRHWNAEIRGVRKSAEFGVWTEWGISARLAVSLALLCVSLVLTLHFSVTKPPCICMVDVDQGDGIFIRTSAGRRVFVDGGSTGVSSVGKYRILPFLKYNGVGSMDYWFVTHSDEDHVSGLMELLQSGYNVKRIILSEYVVMNKNTKELILQAKNSGTEVLFMKAGDVLSDGTDSFECVMPDIPDIGGEKDANEQSLVLCYNTPSVSMLLTGDMGEPAERELLARWHWSSEGKMKILKVAHHGSNGSSCADFLKMVGEEPFISLISAGVRNSYGHPHRDTLQRLVAAGSDTDNKEKNPVRSESEIYRTDKLGQITLVIEGGNVTIGGFVE